MFFLFLLIFLLVVFYVVCDLLTRKYINPYCLYILFGHKGVGKSTLLQKLARYYRKRGYNVYCNIGDSPSSDIIEIPIKEYLPRLAEAGHQIYHLFWTNNNLFIILIQPSSCNLSLRRRASSLLRLSSCTLLSFVMKSICILIIATISPSLRQCSVISVFNAIISISLSDFRRHMTVTRKSAIWQTIL